MVCIMRTSIFKIALLLPLAASSINVRWLAPSKMGVGIIISWRLFSMKRCCYQILSLLMFVMPHTTYSRDSTFTLPVDTAACGVTLQVKVNGQGPFSFILDTGAEEGLIDDVLAQRLKLNVTGKDVLFDGVTEVETDKIEVEVLDIEDFQKTNVPFATAPIRNWFGSELYGIVGFSVFSGYLLTLDYPKGELRLSIGEISTADTTAVDYKYNKDDGLLELEVFVGGKSFQVHLDSGSSLGLTLPYIAASELGLDGQLEQAGMARTINGAFQIWETPHKEPIRIGKQNLTISTLHFVEGMPKGQLGQGILMHMQVSLDQKNGLVDLRWDGENKK